MRYLLDPNIIAEPTKPQPNQPVLDFLTQCEADVVISLLNADFPPSFPDGPIAAIAAMNDLILITRNVSDFIRFNGISVEN